MSDVHADAINATPSPDGGVRGKAHISLSALSAPLR